MTEKQHPAERDLRIPTTPQKLAQAILKKPRKS